MSEAGENSADRLVATLQSASSNQNPATVGQVATVLAALIRHVDLLTVISSHVHRANPSSSVLQELEKTVASVNLALKEFSSVFEESDPDEV